MAGQILGDRYQVEKQLGRKSGRWTLLATDLQTETPVILKMISIDDELHPDMLKLFDREIDILKSLEHPAVPQYLDYFEIDLPKNMKALVLVQSYIEGISVDKYMRQGRVFSEKEAYNIAKAILKILIYLHSHEPCIVHRDIKPSNILITQSSDAPDARTRICLVDFGSVKRLVTKPSNTTVLSLVGDENYMAPEQLGGRAVLSSDLYSLGMSLLSLMTGKTPDELPRRSRGVDVAQISQCSPGFATWLGRMTAVAVHDRVRSAEEALEELRQVTPAD